MSNHPRASRSETTLIVFASVLLGIIIGFGGGFFVGRGSATPVVLVATPIPGPSPQPPTAQLAATTTEPPAATSEPAATVSRPIDAIATVAPAQQPTAQAITAPTPAPATPVSTDQPQAGAATAQTPNRPTIPIPQARTATPVPGRVETITITNERGTSLASEKIRRSPVGAFLSNPTVQFVPGGMELHGDVSDPTNQIGSGPLVVHGNFQKEGANLRFRIDSAQINGAPVPANISDEIEGIINQIFRDELADRKVESYDAQAGQLLVTVSLRQ